jgi:hypothetical protein
MIRIAQFTPSADVLEAIRSLRADEVEMPTGESDESELTSAPSVETSNPVVAALNAKYDRPLTGQYLRARA